MVKTRLSVSLLLLSLAACATETAAPIDGQGDTGSGDTTVAVPDIQATAIRLKDSAIVGQASASDILGKGVQAGRVIRQFDVRDITEATALALMEDMLTGKTP